MIIRVSFMVVASVAALKISQTKTNSTTKRNGSDGSHLEQEFEERENSTANSNHVIQNKAKQINFEMPQNLLTGEFKDLELLIGGEKMHNVTKKEVLQKLVESYKQREVNLERKLLELNGMREEQSAIAQMQKQLEEKTKRLDFLKMTVASLKSESKVIREKIKEDYLSRKQLDIAKKMVKEMERKKDVNGSPVRDQILMLQEQVTEFRKYNSSGRNDIANKKLKGVQDMEVEVLQLKRRNKELELEKREMGIKLATAQARIRTEEEVGTRIKEEITGLRHVHEELSEQVERLQSDKFDMIQELVYQRWLCTLLRFEVKDHQKQSRKVSRRYCSQNPNKELCGKKHSSASDPELESVSSNATLDDSDEIETSTFGSSSSSQCSSDSMKMKRPWKTEDCSNKISSQGRNFSSSFFMSMVTSDVSESRNANSTSKTIESPIMPKIKRVSFSDSVKLSTHQDMPVSEPEVVENAVDNKETRFGQIVALTSSVVSSTNIDSIEKNEGAKNKIGHSDGVFSCNVPVSRKDDRFKTILLQLVLFF
ncbi:Protein CHUP1, chloroplastic, partial [Mucuna pruriens]